MKPPRPIMVVFLAVAAVAMTRPANANFSLNSDQTIDKSAVAAPASQPVAMVDSTNPINEIQAILSKGGKEGEAAKIDVAGRILEFMNEKDADGKSFLAPDVDHTVLAETVKGWTMKEKPGSVAMLYFAMGPGSTRPAWVETSKSLQNKFTSDWMWKDCLRENLADFTDTGSSQIRASSEKTQITSFLNKALTVTQGGGMDATAVNKDIFTTCKSKKDTDDSIAKNGYKVLNPMPGGNLLNTLGAANTKGKATYSFEEMFIKGAVVEKVFKSGDKGYRVVSTKIYTKRVNGLVVNEIGMFDITDPNNIFGQRYPFTTAGKNDVTLGLADDYEYSLHVRTDREGRSRIDLVRRGEKPNEPGKPQLPGQLSTSIEELLLKRAEQARELQNVVTIGGENFYVVPQGGAKGGLVMLSKKVADDGTIDNARETLGAQLYAEIVQRGPEGNAINIKYEKGAVLGVVGGLDYSLVYNAKAKLWEIKQIKGDEPKAAAESDGGAGGGGDSKRGGGADQSIDAIEKTLRDAKDANCLPKEEADTADLDNDLKGKYGIITCGPESMRKLFILVPNKVQESGQIAYEKLVDFKRGRFYKHYVVLQYKSSTAYRDLLKIKGGDLPPAGIVTKNKDNTPGITATDFVDGDLLFDAIQGHTGIQDEAMNKVAEPVLKRIEERAGDKPYTLNAIYRPDRPEPERMRILMQVDDVGYEVWPRNIEDKPSKDLYGRPGNMANGNIGSVDAEFPEILQVDGAHKAKIIDKQADIALYQGSFDKEEKYYLMFRYKTKVDGTVKTMRSNFFEMFSTAKDGRPKPGQYEMAGLDSAGVELANHLEAGYSFVPGSSEKSAVLVISQNRNISGEGVANKRANCAGPILWWGITGGRAAAQKICQNDSF